jgi:hypothetical protein
MLLFFHSQQLNILLHQRQTNLQLAAKAVSSSAKLLYYCQCQHHGFYTKFFCNSSSCITTFKSSRLQTSTVYNVVVSHCVYLASTVVVSMWYKKVQIPLEWEATILRKEHRLVGNMISRQNLCSGSK